MSEQREQIWTEWTRLWKTLDTKFFKFETLQSYWPEENQEAVNMWKAGKKNECVELLKSSRNSFFEDIKARPDLSFVRVRMIKEPRSEYLEFEIAHYLNINIPSGEEILVINESQVPKEILELHDFMMFDDKIVFDSEYSTDGTLRNAKILRDEKVNKFVEAKNYLIQNSQPLRSYLISK